MRDACAERSSASQASSLASNGYVRTWLALPLTGRLQRRPLSNRRFVRWASRCGEIDGTAPGGKGGCLSDALVSVGPAGRGGTGSFISSDGTVITNHHVALDAVRQASATDPRLSQEGFVARATRRS